MVHRSIRRRTQVARHAHGRKRGTGASSFGRGQNPYILSGLVVAVLVLGPEAVNAVARADESAASAPLGQLLTSMTAEDSTPEAVSDPVEELVEDESADLLLELDAPEIPTTPGDSALASPGTEAGGAPGTPGAPGAPGTSAGSWNLVWSDDFNGSTVNSSAWTVLDSSTYGAGNNEVACLMNRTENVAVSGGTLRLTARREATPIACEGGTTRPYTSGHLNTKGKLSFTYGRFEVRAKTPTAPGQSKGLWPAFWMRPVTGGLGEIDIMEQVGTGPSEASHSGWVSQTLWYDYSGTFEKQNFVHKSPVALNNDFHTYAIEWEPGQIRWYVDGIETYRLSSSEVSWMNGTFDQPFYLRLNLAVGGDWPGSPTADTVLPATYEIDFVKVYQR